LKWAIAQAKEDYSMIFLETPRTIVRRFTINDAGFFAAMNGDEEVMRYIRPVKTKEECLTFLKENIQLYADKPTMGRWICIEKSSNLPIGSAAYFPLQNTEDVQIGYSFRKPFWGKGFAKEIVVGLLNYSKSLGDKFVVAITQKENIASQKALLANGFRLDSTYQEGEKNICKFRCDF